MKNFRIYTVILLGLMVSLVSNARVVTLNDTHEKNYNADPYTCQREITIEAYMPNAKYIAYYEYYSDGTGAEYEEFRNKKKATFTMNISRRKILVLSGDQLEPINAPARRSPGSAENAMDEINTYYLVPRTSFIPTRADLFEILVADPVIEHSVVLDADLVTNKAKYKLFSSAGKTDENGKAYCCWDQPYKLVYKKDSYSGKLYLQYAKTNAEFEKELLELAPSVNNYEYFVYNAQKRINAPAVRTFYPYPDEDGYYTDLADHFVITVNYPDCQNDLVYTKWDDVMFVNNGWDGGSGEFVAYQWHCDGEVIEGATEQWIRTEGRPGSKKWYVKITKKDGSVIYTCPERFGLLPASAHVNYHDVPTSAPEVRKLLQNGNLVIECDGKTYNSMGIQIE